MEKTIPGTPQQNGVVERMSITLNERARSMRHVGLPKTFWADAISTAAYLINRGPSVPMKFRLPEKVWSGGEEDKENVNSQVDLSTPVVEPECYDEALQDENSRKKALHNKWICRIKNEHDGSKRYKMSTIRLVLGMVVVENFHLEQLDVKIAFLQGDLEEDLYMIQPKVFIVQGQENLVCKRERACMALNKLLDSGFDIEKINDLKKQLSKQFAMKDLGAAKQILAKLVSTPLGSHFKLSKEQSPKIGEERDHMSKVPYASTIGSLMYAMVCTRPDIAHAVGIVSRFMSMLGKQHWEGYVDVDFDGDIDSRKSTTRFVFTLGGIAISWASNLQKIVTLSTTEAEYVAATEVRKEMIWLHGFLDELGKKQKIDILHSDNRSAIFLAKNLAFHSKSKFIQTKYNFIRYLVKDKLVIFEKICGSKNPTDMLTKGVTIEKLKLCAASIGLLA
ncbi:Retrovirus-related Pol polyprotein from transposon TNT 1-94 [Vitis vinifera]|uniref:Retrovirus-related Pol polyprotein from transposon TNT 1-94 n=1 Tax=Vitis vinifera TaxID=29760 RepID=A0A438C4D8_VITVI|nr:Retrovirus-related Pol polyprotein from transposon TNT 1-94 [Vitis vinifera]